MYMVSPKQPLRKSLKKINEKKLVKKFKCYIRKHSLNVKETVKEE